MDPSVFLNHSSIPTMHFQDSLPRMPIPPLADTVDKYIEALKPVVSEAQFAEAVVATAEFVANEGPELHKKLVERDQARLDTSYINEW